MNRGTCLPVVIPRLAFTTFCRFRGREDRIVNKEIETGASQLLLHA